MHLKKLLLPLLLCTLAGCDRPFTPKERGYFRIGFPERSYRPFDEPGYPYAFDYPVYGRIAKDSSLIDDNPDNPYWINVEFPQFNGRIYLSYKTIGGYSVYKVKRGDRYEDSTVANTFEGLRDEAYRMTFKHTLKASGIADSVFRNGNGVSGVYFRLEGDAATMRQFFVTDSTRHFLRGALYFDSSPNADSLSVVNDFLEKDMLRLIGSLRWK
jgi:gliding motility-associated lipoprotein GldD